jgi:hypothetical protein
MRLCTEGKLNIQLLDDIIMDKKVKNKQVMEFEKVFSNVQSKS